MMSELTMEAVQSAILPMIEDREQYVYCPTTGKQKRISAFAALESCPVCHREKENEPLTHRCKFEVSKKEFPDIPFKE